MEWWLLALSGGNVWEIMEASTENRIESVLMGDFSLYMTSTKYCWDTAVPNIGGR